MFVYFLQRKGFIDRGDLNYLQNKLAASKQRGKDRFFSEFLQALFFEAFAKLESDRDPKIQALVGKIKYLNGGLFLKHRIEREYPNIAIIDFNIMAGNSLIGLIRVNEESFDTVGNANILQRLDADNYRQILAEKNRSIELCKNHAFQAEEVGLESYKNGVTDETERSTIKAELDAIIAHLYALSETEFQHILSTFPLVPEETKQATLAAYKIFAPLTGDPEIIAITFHQVERKDICRISIQPSPRIVCLYEKNPQNGQTQEYLYIRTGNSTNYLENPSDIQNYCKNRWN
jgi:hypothetical protein